MANMLALDFLQIMYWLSVQYGSFAETMFAAISVISFLWCI